MNMRAVQADPIPDRYSGGSGDPVLLLHGVNASWGVWKPVIPLLEPRLTVHALTMAGHRCAPPLPAHAGVETIADDLERRLDTLGLEKCHLVGNSLGGWVALELAMRGRGSSVVAFSPAGSWAEPKDLKRLTRLMKTARRAGLNRAVMWGARRPKLRRAMFRAATEHADRMSDDDVEGMFADLAACTALDGVLEQVWRDGPMNLSRLQPDTPVRIAWPERDRTIPYERYGRTITEQLPHADVVRLPGVGHVPMLDDPALIAATITDFVSLSRRP